jgi:hypothetical protein
MRTITMAALLAAIAAPLAGCVVNSREPSRTVVREPAAPSTTVVAPAPSATVVAPVPRASVVVGP